MASKPYDVRTLFAVGRMLRMRERDARRNESVAMTERWRRHGAASAEALGRAALHVSVMVSVAKAKAKKRKRAGGSK